VESFQAEIFRVRVIGEFGGFFFGAFDFAGFRFFGRAGRTGQDGKEDAQDNERNRGGDYLPGEQDAFYQGDEVNFRNTSAPERPRAQARERCGRTPPRRLCRPASGKARQDWR